MSKVINQGASKLVPVDAVKPHPRNPNQGDQGAVMQSIEANGFYGAIVVQQSTGYVLAGNHRLAAAKAEGIAKVPVIYVDVDEETALRILVADNRTAALAMQDEHALAEILKELAGGDGLDGSGFDGDDLDALVKRLEGDDEFIQRERDGGGAAYEEQYGVIVVCDDEEHQADVYERLQAQGFTCKVVVT